MIWNDSRKTPEHPKTLSWNCFLKKPFMIRKSLDFFFLFWCKIRSVKQGFMSTYDFMPWPSSVIKRKQKRRRVYYHATVSLSLRSSATTFFATGWTIVVFQAVPNIKGGLISESSFSNLPKKVPKTFLITNRLKRRCLG